ncbi:MAG: hypothetical protein RJA71_435, partial [Actinomycetota bacterium]
MKFTRPTKTPLIFLLTTTVAVATAMLVTPSVQANTFSAPNSPTSVTSYLGAGGVVVRWTPGASVNPEVTGYVVSAGAG